MIHVNICPCKLVSQTPVYLSWLSPSSHNRQKKTHCEDKVYLSISLRKYVQETHQSPNYHQIICKKMHFAHKCKDMPVTFTLYSPASVRPPHLRLHGGPSASPCLMLFSAEQRIFVWKAQVHSSAVLVEAGAAYAAALVLPSLRRPTSTISQRPAGLHKGSASPVLGVNVQDSSRGCKHKTSNSVISCKLFVFYR